MIQEVASHSLIQYMLDEKRIENIPTVKLKSVNKSFFVNQKVAYKYISELKNDSPLTFLLFKFHNYFDELIGLNILSQLKASINLETYSLTSPKIKLLSKPNIQ